jgi:hypothetical protein
MRRRTIAEMMANCTHAVILLATAHSSTRKLHP